MSSDAGVNEMRGPAGELAWHMAWHMCEGGGTTVAIIISMTEGGFNRNHTPWPSSNEDATSTIAAAFAVPATTDSTAAIRQSPAPTLRAVAVSAMLCVAAAAAAGVLRGRVDVRTHAQAPRRGVHWRRSHPWVRMCLRQKWRAGGFSRGGACPSAASFGFGVRWPARGA